MTDLFSTAPLFGLMVVAIVLGVTRPVSVSGGQPPAAVRADRDATKQAQGVSFQGRVVDLDDDRPIEGAEVVVERSVLIPFGEPEPGWAGRTKLRTDAQGRFTITFPPEQVAEPRIQIALTVNHPDYVSRQAYLSPLISLLRGREFGDRPFFEKVTLEKGLVFSGKIVTPEGEPAANVPFTFVNWTGRNNDRPSWFVNDTTGRTDGQGRFRLRMPKTQTLTISVAPKDYALFYQFWGTDRPDQNTDIWAPTELGQLVLERGQVITGRMLDVQGRPIAGEHVIADGLRYQHNRMATTQADGSFRFAPVRPGNYTVYADGQHTAGSVETSARPMPHGVHPIRPAHVFFRKGQRPAAVELRELPSVSVEVHYVDSKGLPTRAGFATLGGTVPNEPVKLNGQHFGAATKNSLTDLEENEEQDQQMVWGRQLLANTDGRIHFHVPKGLREASLFAIPPDETIAYKTRLTENGPLKYWGGGQLGTIDADRTITVVSYHSPTVMASVQTDAEQVPERLEISARFIANRHSYADSFTRQSDGRYRSVSLMPDHEYQFSASAQGYVPNRVHRLTLKEASFTELALILRAEPKPPEVGKPAPPFLVKALDGQVLSPDDLRGKFVLIHFWMPNLGLKDESILKAMHERYGKDGRLTMIGFSLADDPADAAKLIKDHGLTWPQVVLRDGGADPIALEYRARHPFKSFLIGPDGTLVARDLEGDGIEKAIAEAIGRK